VSAASANGAPHYSLYTAQVSVSYAPDVFGGTRRAVESQQAQEDNQRFEMEAAYLTLASNVVAAAIQEVSTRAQIAATEDIILPQITLTLFIGTQANSLGAMFGPGTYFWSLVGSATQTVFDGGALLHKKHAADEALVQSAAQYRSTVISAFQNVADTLHALLSDADALKGGGGVGTRGAGDARPDATPVAGWLRQFSNLTASRAGFSDRHHQSRAGTGQPLQRHRCAVPGAGRRLVAPDRATDSLPLVEGTAQGSKLIRRNVNATPRIARRPLGDGIG
jgi:hypothetical protein